MLAATAVSALVAAALASCLACIPGLHIYNVLAVLVVAAHALHTGGNPVPVEPIIAGATALVTAYALLNTIPSVLLAAPDESAVFTVLPGRKYLMNGRGYDACRFTLWGGALALAAIVLVVVPLAPTVLPAVQTIVRPHAHWIVWAVIAFMLQAEWPKGGTRGPAGRRRLLDGWATPAAGLATFVLSGWLGFVLFYRSPLNARYAFQNIMPAFIGLFTVPSLLLNLLAGTDVPAQSAVAQERLPRAIVLKGTLAGLAGGGFAAFIPAVTAGVGGMLAGHATAIRDDRTFLVSQGASKLAYYVGSCLFLFVPGLWLTRGGAAWMLRTFELPRDHPTYLAAVAGVIIGAAVALLLARPLIRRTLVLIATVGYQRLSTAALLLVAILVLFFAGFAGLGVAAVATAIGLLPILFGSRRMNALGIILLPVACNLSGAGPRVAAWLGLG